MELEDRAADTWEPLLMIADLAGGDWPQRGLNAAKRLMPTPKATRRTPTPYRCCTTGATSSPGFRASSPRPRCCSSTYARWRSRRGAMDLNTHGLARLLRAFDIHSTRNSTGTKRCYKRNAFTDAWERYPSTERDEGE
jgi:hypothetical protein